jgi:prevent-host-death family protein
MTQVGVRELRQRASELLRRVEAGETFEVTDRGRPVAVLSPLPEASPLDRLRTSGDVTPALASIDDLPEPIRLAPDQEPPSSVLARLRRDER